MAKPRVFISSTYFDLKAVRADLEQFVRDQGFEPVLHERGQVAYGKDQPLENYCYEEIESCDIVISIVGGRFGTQSQGSNYSISQSELKKALDNDKQVHIFVERDVYHEYRTFVRNKETSLKWASVDNDAIFKFLEEIYALKNNNPVLPFETSQDVTRLLREQWAGLFQRLLQQATQQTQAIAAMELRQGLETVKSLIDALGSQSEGKDELINEIHLANHPVFGSLRKTLSVPYRFMFYDRSELKKWLKMRGYVEVDEDAWDDPEFAEWTNSPANSETYNLLKVHVGIFEKNGKLRMFTNDTWKNDWITKEVRRPPDNEDDVPF